MLDALSIPALSLIFLAAAGSVWASIAAAKAEEANARKRIMAGECIR